MGRISSLPALVGFFSPGMQFNVVNQRSTHYIEECPTPLKAEMKALFFFFLFVKPYQFDGGYSEDQWKDFYPSGLVLFVSGCV